MSDKTSDVVGWLDRVKNGLWENLVVDHELGLKKGNCFIGKWFQKLVLTVLCLWAREERWELPNKSDGDVLTSIFSGGGFWRLITVFEYPNQIYNNLNPKKVLSKKYQWREKREKKREENT